MKNVGFIPLSLLFSKKIVKIIDVSVRFLLLVLGVVIMFTEYEIMILIQFNVPNLELFIGFMLVLSLFCILCFRRVYFLLFYMLVNLQCIKCD